MGKKVLVTVFSSAIEPKTLSRIEKLVEGGDSVVVIGKDLPSMPGNQSIPCKRFDDYFSEEELDAIEQDVLKFMEQLPKANPKLADAITYKRISTWEVSAFNIFRLFFVAFKYVKAARKIIEKEKPDSIIIIGGKESIIFWRNIEQALNQKKKTRFFKMASWIANSRKTTLEEDIIGKVASTMGIVVERNHIGLWANLRHLFVSRLLPPLFWIYFDWSDLRRRLSERNAGKPSRVIPSQNKVCFFVSSRNISLSGASVIKELQKNEANDVLVVRVDSLTADFVREALNEQGIPFRTYETYIDIRVWSKTVKGIIVLLMKSLKLRTNKTIQEQMTYDSIALWTVLRDRLSSTLSMLLPEAIKYIEVAKNLIEREKPDIFVLMDELSPWERAVAYKARLKGIPTLNLQSMVYGSRESPICVSTDKVALGGELIKQMAIKRKGEAYRDRFVITGDPRFEYNLQAIKDFDPAQFKKQLGLKTDSNVILFTSTSVQLAATVELRERLLNCVYNAVKELPEKQFVVKLHPGEDFDLHYKLRQDLKLENVVITKDTNLYQLFVISDLMMTYYSTTALEAMLLDKPVIEINLTGKPDALPNVERGAAIGVYKEEDLVPTIKEVLNNESVRSRLAEARKKFVYDYVYLQDGKASRRVADLIERMIKEKKAPIVNQKS